MEDGYQSSFSVPVLDIVKMVLEIQQEENNKSEYRDGFETTEEYLAKVLQEGVVSPEEVKKWLGIND
ncbi:hypothetical protein PBI_GRAYSON_44 [Rhodococcus phage Grayson]|nr:hypothetical protein PBI_GRAYSON_44 [Rhodococcus phage Grayson]